MIRTIARRRRLGISAAGTVAILLGLGLMQAAPVTPAEADSVNLLGTNNPGFESDFDTIHPATATILYWKRYPSDPLPQNSNTSVWITTAQAYSGDQSAYILDGNSGAGVGLLSHYAHVNLAASYTAGARVKVITGEAIVYLKFYNIHGIEVGEVAKTVTGSANEWTPVRLNGTPPPTADHARVVLYSSTSNRGSAYVDDVTLTEHPNLLHLKNPGFEQDSGTPTILYWKRYPSDPLPSTTSSVSVTQDQAHTESSSVLITDNDPSLPIGLYSQAETVQPYADYSASASVRVVTGKAIVSLRFYNSANAEIGNSVKSVSEPINQWKQVWVESTAPAAAAYARVVITSGSTTVGESYVDDVSFSEADPVFSSFGAPVDLGEATFTTKTLGGVIGNGEVYFVTNGAPGTFYALDATTGAVIFHEQVPGTTETWALTIGSDGMVYFASTASTKFWRYDPVAKEVTPPGYNPTGDKYVWDLDASSDGVIYGGTSSNTGGDGKVFSYDIATNDFTDLGTIFAGEDYVHGVGVTDQYVYAGIGGLKHLVRIDRETGAKVPILLPADVEGKAGFIHNIWAYDGLLYIRDGTALIVMDEDAPHDVKYQTLVTDVNTFDGMISPPSPANSDLLYFRNKNTSTLWTYNAATSSIHAVTPTVALPNINAKAMNWVTISGHQVLGMLFENGNYQTYDPQPVKACDHPQPGKACDHSGHLPASAVTVNSIAAGPDDNKLYLGGYIDGMSIFDEGDQSYDIHSSPTSPGQVESTGFLNSKVYFGAYPGARIYRYDAAAPYAYGTNPGLVYTAPDTSYQGRPYTFESGDNKLFVGTVPAYQYEGGSLVIYDDTTKEWTSTRNVVQNQSIVSLAYKNGTLFGGTSIYGGLGKSNTTTTAHMFTWASGAKTDEFIPAIPGMSSPELIGDLSFGPDGLLWGAAYGQLSAGGTGFAIYAMDAGTHEIVKSSLMYYDLARGNYWREFYLDWGADGMLYTTIGRFVTVVDPDTLAYRKLVDTNNTVQTHVMALGDDGSLYYGKGSHLLKLPRVGS